MSGVTEVNILKSGYKLKVIDIIKIQFKQVDELSKPSPVKKGDRL